MRVLFLAPQPFYQERGTPIAVRLLLRALSERGDQVHLLTFPEGEDIELPGLVIDRVQPFPRVENVRPGFSFRKVYTDLFLAGRAARLVHQLRPDIIHATEEGVFLARHLGALYGVPYVYDMDSSMTGQMADRFPALSGLLKGLAWIENDAIRSARVVVPMCESLATEAREAGAKDIVVLKDVSLLTSATEDDGDLADEVLQIRSSLGLEGRRIVLYIGNLEPYQGIDLLYDAFRKVHAEDGQTALVVVGGAAAHVAEYRQRVSNDGLESEIHFVGPQPVSHLGPLMAQADVLASPRTQGENTPMKVYSYLDSGVPVLATDLPTHTQVVTEEEAALAAPEVDAYAEVMARLLSDPAWRRSLAAKARELIRREHSWPVFRERVHELYGRLESDVSGSSTVYSQSSSPH